LQKHNLLEILPPYITVALAICKHISAEVERLGSEKRGAETIGCVSYLALLNMGLGGIEIMIGGEFQLLGGRDNIVFIEVAALAV
jgi:hypothetical protein